MRRLGLALLLVASVARAGVEDDLRDGDRYFEDGEWQKAAGAIDRAIAKAPGQVPAAAYAKRAAIYIIVKSYQPGLEFIAKAKLRHPGAPEILEQEALILWETDRRVEAIAVAEQVVSVRPQTFTNQKLIGEHYSCLASARIDDVTPDTGRTLYGSIALKGRHGRRFEVRLSPSPLAAP